MIIAAVADVHSPRYFVEFVTSLGKFSQPDLFLLAGDIINRGSVEEYPIVVDAIDRFFGEIPIVACFGNEEYAESRDEITSLVGNRVHFLDASTATLNLAGNRLGIVGASALLESSDDISDIRTFFENRANRITKLLRQVHRESRNVILLMHYSPLEEDNHSFSWWVARAIKNVEPNIIVHGHVHSPFELELLIGSTTVHNVALPAVGSITELFL
ncbi:MAG: metallophosphoesterase [Candidatus Thorarchaeota archaeon]